MRTNNIFLDEAGIDLATTCLSFVTSYLCDKSNDHALDKEAARLQEQCRKILRKPYGEKRGSVYGKNS